MSEAMHLLNSLNVEDYLNPNPVNDILTINANGRITSIPGTEMLMGVETDTDVERKYFKCPRIVGDRIDLSTLSLRVHYKNANGEKDKYIVNDVTVDGAYITFSWLLSNKVLAYKGTIYFTIVAVKANNEGDLVKCWNTTLASGNVLEGLAVDDLDDLEEEKARDVLLQLLNMLETEADSYVTRVRNAGNIEVSNVQAEGASQQEAVAKKGVETLATIPEEYTALNNLAEQNKNDIYNLAKNKANAIVGEVVGETIYVQDAAEQPPVELSLFGKTEQGDYTNGYQLFDASRLTTKTGGGVTIINNGDGSFTISGSGTLSEGVWTHYTLTDEEYSKIMQVGNILYVNAMPITNPFVFFGLYDSDNANIASLSNRQGVSEKLTITQDLVDQSVMARFYILANANSTVQAGTIKPMYYMEGDGTWERFSGGKPGPNPEYPFEMDNVDSPRLYKVGKNLINMEDNAGYVDGKIKLEYTGYNSIGPHFDFIPAIPGQTYTFSYVVENGGDRAIVQLLDSNYKELKNINIGWGSYLEAYAGAYGEVGDGATFTIPKDTTAKYLRVVMCKMNTCGEGGYNIYSKCQLEYGPVVTEYEEFKKETLSIPYTLRGLKVAAGGNIVDSSGQMWCGDEIDFEQGVLKQRILHSTYDGSLDEDWHLGNGTGNGVDNRFETSINDISALTKPGMYVVANGCCDTFMYKHSGGIPPVNNFRIGTNAQLTIAYALFNPDTSIVPFEDVTAWRAWLAENPIEVDMTLREPIEIQLTESEIAAYRQVLMSNSITTLYNTSGAPMRLRYAKDTALCIGTKTEEITLSASKWVEQDGGSHYTQVVSVSGVTANTRIDLNPTPEQLISIVDEGLSMFAANQNGVVTVYCMGGKPATDMTLPIAKQEVVYV